MVTANEIPLGTFEDQTRDAENENEEELLNEKVVAGKEILDVGNEIFEDAMDDFGAILDILRDVVAVYTGNEELFEWAFDGNDVAQQDDGCVVGKDEGGVAVKSPKSVNPSLMLPVSLKYSILNHFILGFELIN